MPFKSEAQRRLMWAKHPKIAKRWAHEKGAKNKGLPWHTKKAEEEMEDEHPNNGEILEGGKGDNKPDSEFNKEKLKEGVKHEREHTKKKQIAKEIAKDHLTEDKDYYERLEAIEKKGAFEYGFFDELQKIAASDFAVAGLGGHTRTATAPLRVLKSALGGGLLGGLAGLPLEAMTDGNTGVPLITALLGALTGGTLSTLDERDAYKHWKRLNKRD
jgi:hypothetical protein